MSETIRLESPVDVMEALTSPWLVPPPRPDNVGPGVTADLREAMARFSYGDAHQSQRQILVALIEALEHDEIEARAFHEASGRLGDTEIEAIGTLAESVSGRCTWDTR